jgi:hypothetical protein
MITTGRISTRHNARTHIAINGRTMCGTKSHAPIAHPSKTYAGIDRSRLCKLCFTPAHLTILQREATTGPKWSAALDNFLCDVRLIVGYEPQTAEVRTVFRVAPAVAPRVREMVKPAPGTWGSMAAGFKRTHPQRVAA